MKLEKTAAIAEIVSSVAIVVTLAYLAIETRQNTEALLAESRQTVLTTAGDILGSQIEYPEIVLSIIKPEPLTQTEMIQLNAWYVTALRSREFAWQQYRNGIIDDAQWQTELTVLQVVLQPPRTQNWWNKLGRPVFGEEFAAFVDMQLAGLPERLDWTEFVNSENY